MRMMVDALLKNALEQGTLNWDVTIVQVLTLVLVASLHCRTGDISRGHLDDQPMPYLTYEDVHLKLVNGTEMEHLEARVKVRNEKGHK